MTTNLNINVQQSVVDGVYDAINRLTIVIERGEDRDAAVLGFMGQAAVAEAIAVAYDGSVRDHGHGIPGLSTDEAHDAIAAALHALISHKVHRATTAFGIIELALTIAGHMIRETRRVMVLTDTAQLNHARDGEWDALANFAWRQLASMRWGAKKNVDEAMGLAFDALLVSTPKRLAASYATGTAPDLGVYLYLEDLETWFTALVTDCARRALNETRFPTAYPLPPNDELPDDGGDEDEDGGILDGRISDLPPGGRGGGVAPTRREQERARDQRRIESLRELVATAERVLSEKQRLALVTKLFSPKREGARAAMIRICLEAVREVPREINSDGELALVIGSPSASAAQRNYNHGRAKLLEFARDADQREEWCVILDALLPRRSRGATPSGDSPS